ncbi:MAG TPA: hypothetical protein VHD63_28265, partial [Ktedonobacteraceae bacterium]|nr:hypothetical protein [Ktedonobacteraceae bacterium]
LDARNGHQRWNITAGVVDVYQLNAPVIAPNGHIYIASDTPSTTTDDYSQYIGRHMEEIEQTSGNAIWNVSFSSEIGGYVLVL